MATESTSQKRTQNSADKMAAMVKPWTPHTGKVHIALQFYEKKWLYSQKLLFSLQMDPCIKCAKKTRPH
jgi:hypothetical protein